MGQVSGGPHALRAQALVRFDEAAAREWLESDAERFEGGETYIEFIAGPTEVDEYYLDVLVDRWSAQGGFGAVSVMLAPVSDRDGNVMSLTVLVDIAAKGGRPLRTASSWTEPRKVHGLSIDDDRPVLDRLVSFLSWVADEARGAVGCAFAAIDEL